MFRKLTLAAGLFVALLRPAAAEPLPRSTPEAQGIASQALLEFLAALEEIDQMNSVMLVRHGHVVAEGWWAPYSATERHMLYSLSKSFCSTAVGMAIAEGKLTLDDPVLSFFPDEAPPNPSDNLKAMRVRDLLAMNTGHHADFVRAFDFRAKTSLTKAFLAAEVGDKPGTHFEYNTPATYMCSAIVQERTGQKVLDYLRPRLFEPLGIEEPTWSESGLGVTSGGFGLNVRTEDIAKFGQLYLQQGAWNGKQLIEPGWIALATSKQTSNGSNPDSDWEQGYGFQFWRCRHDCYRGDGAFGQYCLVMPKQDAVLAITSGVRDMGAVLNAAWNKLLPALQEDALPTDDAAHGALTAKLAALQVVPVDGEISSPRAAEVSGVVYDFPANDMQLEAAWLNMQADHVRLHLQIAGEDYSIPCRYRRWYRSGEAPLIGVDPRAELPLEPIAGGYAWRDPQTFAAKICYFRTPFYLTFQLRFDGDQLHLASERNVSFGPTSAPELVGKRRGE